MDELVDLDSMLYAKAVRQICHIRHTLYQVRLCMFTLMVVHRIDMLQEALSSRMCMLQRLPRLDAT